MATFYFNGAVDGDWQTLGNWWMSYDAETNTHSVPATALPTSTDDIEVRSAISSNSGSAPTVANATFFSGALNAITITVTGLCTFNGGAYNAPTGNITGDCIFNNSSNVGTITGNCTFNESNAWHQNENWDYPGLITGNCTFNYGAGCSADIIGDCTFNDGSRITGSGRITGNCTFNDSSHNSSSISYYYSSITGNCTFNDYSYNESSITGLCTFNDNSSTSSGSTITGNCTFNDDSDAFLNSYIYGDCTFNGTSVNNGTVDGNATFNDESYQMGRVNWTATFNDNSRLFYNPGGGDPGVGSVSAAIFSLSAAALNLKEAINGHRPDAFSWQATIEFKYDKGINGSSILGVV